MSTTTKQISDVLATMVGALDQTNENKLVDYVDASQALFTGIKDAQAVAVSAAASAEAQFQSDFQTSKSSTQSAISSMVDGFANNVDAEMIDSLNEANAFLTDRSDNITSLFGDLISDENDAFQALIDDIGDAGTAEAAFAVYGIDASQEGTAS